MSEVILVNVASITNMIEMMSRRFANVDGGSIFGTFASSEMFQPTC